MIAAFIIFCYLAILLIIGLTSSKRIKGKDDFWVAGRSLPVSILVATLVATWIGSGALFSVADLSYHHGFSSLIASAGGWLGILLVYFIAHRIRLFKLYTIPDILELRYNRTARMLASVATILAQITIVSYQLRAGGWILHMVTHGRIPEGTAICIMTVFIILYTLFAGMFSVAYMDVLNGLVMVGGILIAIPFLIQQGGGLSTIVAQVTPRTHPVLGNMKWPEALGYFIPTFLLALGNPNVYQRFYSAKDQQSARRSVMGWLIGVIIVGVGIQSLAVMGSSLFKGLSSHEAGKILLFVAIEGVPEIVGYILLVAMVAIVISTGNSFLLTPATNMMRDIVQRFIYPKIADKELVWGTRLFLVIFGGIAYTLVGFYPRVLKAAYAAYTMYGASITPALMAVFFWKRVTPIAGTLSIFLGISITIIWEIWEKISGGLPLGLPAIYPAFCIAVLSLIGVSLFMKKS